MNARRRPRRRATAATTFAILLATRAALAGNTVNWAATAGGSYDYNDPANWTGGVIPGDGDTANLQVDLPDADQFINITSPVGVNALKIGDTIHQFTFGRQFLSGAPITFHDASGAAGGGSIESIYSENGTHGLYPNAIDNDLIVTAPLAETGLSVNVPTGTLKLGGSMAAATPGSPIQVSFNTPEIIFLNGINNYAGVTRIVGGGRLSAGRAGALSPNSDLVAGRVDFNGFDQTVRAITASDIRLGSGTLTVTFGSSPTSTISGISGSGGLIVDGNASTTLNLKNATQTGAITLRGGTLAAASAGSLGGVGASLIIPSGSAPTLSLPNGAGAYPTQLDGDLTIVGTAKSFSFPVVALNLAGAGRITFSGGMQLTGANTYTSDTIITGTLPLVLRSGVSGTDAQFGAAGSSLILKPGGILGVDSRGLTTSRNFIVDAAGGDAGIYFIGSTSGSSTAPLTFQGVGNNSFTGRLQVSTPMLTFNRSGGTTFVSQGASAVFSGFFGNPTLTLGGSADALSDGTHHLDLFGVVALNVNQGVKNVGVVEASPNSTSGSLVNVALDATLIATHVRVGGFAQHSGSIIIRPNSFATGVSTVNNLNLELGRVDVTDNKIVDRASDVGSFTTVNGAHYTGVTGLIQSGRNGGHWNGAKGITTSQSDATQRTLTSIGVASAAQVKKIAGTQTAVWAGQTVTAGNTLVMYTYAGDANLDGKINVDDYGRIDLSAGTARTGWFNGDFNYDGKINIDDYAIIDMNVGLQGAAFFTGSASSGAQVTAVPEPAGIFLCGIVCGVIASRGRKPGRFRARL